MEEFLRIAPRASGESLKFWDSSAIVPLIVAEATTQTMQRLYADDPMLVVWWGTEVECVSAIVRVERAGDVLPIAGAREHRIRHVVAGGAQLALSVERRGEERMRRGGVVISVRRIASVRIWPGGVSCSKTVRAARAGNASDERAVYSGGSSRSASNSSPMVPWPATTSGSS